MIAVPIIQFKYDNVCLDVTISPEEDTVWLTKGDMALLFNVDRTRISRHINNIFKELELDYNSNVRKTHFALSTKQVNTYSLDVILAVGYRVKSSRGIIFRRWATSVLKQYLLSGLHKHKLQFYLTKPYQQLMNTLTIFLTKNSMKAK